ncbi:MAG: CHAT domain-containing protein [Calditrichaeota bacterium]|nr:CHAT domain-containing protein [Calditrichota bacterium]
MRRPVLMLLFVVLHAVSTCVVATAQEWFTENFSTPTLSPAWSISSWSGTPWSYHVPSRFSLSAHPGHLRFLLGAMVVDHPRPSFSGYWYYPSLELRRRIMGNRWVCLLKVTYFLPLTNMREFYTDICFGGPDEPASFLRLARCRDIEPRFDKHIVMVKSGDRAAQASMLHPDDKWASERFTYYYRIVREGETLTVQWSADGHLYTTALVFDMGPQVASTEQWLAIRGASWFTPSGSYADYDYIILAPPDRAAESANSSPEHASAKTSIASTQSALAPGQARLPRLERLVQETEQVTPHLLEEEFKASFLSSRMWVYEEVVSALFELHQRQPGHGYQREAFRYAERAKARAFLQLLAEGRIRVREGSSPVLLAREQELMDQVAAAEARLARSTVTEADKRQLARELSSAITELGKLRTEIMQENMRYAQLSYPEPLPTDSIQNDLRDGSVLLQFFLGEQRSYLWMVTADTVAMYVLPGREDVERHARFYIGLLSARPVIESYAEAGRHLFSELLGQVPAEQLRGRHLVIVPDGALNYLPFGALMVQGDDHFLADDCVISYAPSATILHILRRWRATQAGTWERELVAIGAPHSLPEFKENGGLRLGPLKHARRELEQVGKNWPKGKTLTVTGREANETRVKSGLLAHARYVHFATHSLLDEATISRSCLVLAPGTGANDDGLLRMSEVFDLHLHAELVVLSACQTARGRLYRGEGVRGLTRAFLYAGASSVMVSLWDVEDRSTADLMQNFYGYLAQGMSKTEALRAAQLALRRSGSRAYRHPYYWAPFVLIGDDR